ncbi:LamG domain-containing protein [Halomonas alimentaria]|uniref:LamG-like jellyroll fold domain-containing protein n=1 Tax=Halomonas alimentaria TaxID=147248 RepID=A0A7X4W2N5_9GAMM|nr:LamG domain-containing protein [Halomonas alimentaria]NAW33253.1 hypothetical protein [Halomonas alimentaria]
MGIRIRWLDNNLAEEGHRLYRSDSPMDVNAMPAPLALMGADATEYDDADGIVPGQTYYYRIGAFVGGVEKISDELVMVATEDPVPLQGLVLHYTMNSITGSSLADETGSYDGTISGAMQVAGRFGNALAFDGENDYVDVGAIIPLETFTVSFWQKGRAVGGRVYDGGRGLGPLESGLKGFQIKDGSVEPFLLEREDGTSFKIHPEDMRYRYGHDDAWHHVVWQYDRQSGQARGYVDGRLSAKGVFADNGSSLLGAYNHRLGGPANGASVQYLAAELDQLRLYARFLTEFEVYQLYMEATS